MHALARAAELTCGRGVLPRVGTAASSRKSKLIQSAGHYVVAVPDQQVYVQTANSTQLNWRLQQHITVQQGRKGDECCGTRSGLVNPAISPERTTAFGNARHSTAMGRVKAKLAVREPVGIALLLQGYQAASSAELGSRVSEV